MRTLSLNLSETDLAALKTVAENAKMPPALWAFQKHFRQLASDWAKFSTRLKQKGFQTVTKGESRSPIGATIPGWTKDIKLAEVDEAPWKAPESGGTLDIKFPDVMLAALERGAAWDTKIRSMLGVKDEDLATDFAGWALKPLQEDILTALLVVEQNQMDAEVKKLYPELGPLGA